MRNRTNGTGGPFVPRGPSSSCSSTSSAKSFLCGTLRAIGGDGRIGLFAIPIRPEFSVAAKREYERVEGKK